MYAVSYTFMLIVLSVLCNLYAEVVNKMFYIMNIHLATFNGSVATLNSKGQSCDI
jgi:hypothetical protein